MFWRSLVSVLAVAGVVSAQVSGPGAYTPGSPFNAPYWGAFGQRVPTTGQMNSLTIPSANWTSITDLLPVTQFINFSGDANLKGLSTGGTYNFGATPTPSSNNLQFTAVSPGYTCNPGGCTLGAINRTIWATGNLRQTAPNQASPTERSAGGNAQIGIAFSGLIYSGDALSNGVMKAALYTGGADTTGFTLTNNSTKPYSLPTCAWVTDPGQAIESGQSFTVEMFCAHGYGQNLTPVAGIAFTAYDAGAAHSVTKYITAVAQSTRLWSTTCTATNGSNVLTACTNTWGLYPGERLTIPGMPGSPEIDASFTPGSSSITLDQVTTSTSSTFGALQITTAPGVGEAFADHAYVGSKITATNLTGSPVTVTVPKVVASTVGSSTTLVVASITQGQLTPGSFISGTGITAGTYITQCPASSFANCGTTGNYTMSAAMTVPATTTVTGTEIGGQPQNAAIVAATGVNISTSATVGSGASVSTTIAPLFRGSTNTVTVTLGNPVPVYAATFSSGDLSALNGKAAIYFRAQVYPYVGDATAVLDTQTGADGTNCDWFWQQVNGTTGIPLSGVCNSSSPAWFATNGQGVSANLHNLWEYYDSDNSYQPIYIPIGTGGTCTTAGCISATGASMPTSGCTTTCFDSPFDARTVIQTYNNSTNRNGGGVNSTTAHNDLNGAVFCYLSGTYSGFGGQINNNVTANKPGITMTSVVGGQQCPASGSVQSDTANVQFQFNATIGNRTIPTNSRVNNISLTYNGGQSFDGRDGQNSATFLITQTIFNNDIVIGGTAAQLTLDKIGVPSWYNSYLKVPTGENYVLKPNSVTGMPQAFGNTIVGGAYNSATTVSQVYLFNFLGNTTYGLSLTTPPGMSVGVAGQSALSYIAQPIAPTFAFNRVMSSPTTVAINQTTALIPRIADIDNIIECVNITTSACHQISADNGNTFMGGGSRSWNTVIGERTNEDYLEGIPQAATANIALTGNLSGNYIWQIDDALKSAPTVRTSTDGTVNAAVTVPATGSLKLTLPPDPNYVYTVYADTTAPPGPPTHYASIGTMVGGTGGVPSTNLVISAITTTNSSFPVGATINGTGIVGTPKIVSCPSTCLVTGTYVLDSAQTISAGTTLKADATQLAAGQSVLMIDVGSSATGGNAPLVFANVPAHNEQKFSYVRRGNIDYAVNMKTDTYGPASGTNGPNGARVGNWEGRWWGDSFSNVFIVGGTINSGTIGPTAGQGEIVCWLCTYNSGGSVTDLSWVTFSADHSFGVSAAKPNYPAANIGFGNYCPASATHVANVPAGYQQYPFDIQGNARDNVSGSAWSGAFEATCK